MPNYNIVIDTGQFKPFDYSLALNAINEYNTGYEKLQAVYDKIALTLGDLASAVEGSTRAKQIYDAYLKLFNSAAGDFANGMNIRNARELGNLRRIYGTLIRLLERANEAMVKEAERRRALAGSDRNMLYLNIGNLDDWLENPNRVLGSYSGTLLSAEVSGMMKSAASDMIKLDNDGKLDPYTKKWLKTKGFSSSNVNKAIAEVLQGGIDNVKDDIMRGILKSAMQSSGIYSWADEDTRRKAEIIASRGLYGGIGQSEIGTYEDFDKKEATKHYYHELLLKNNYERQLSLLREKEKLEKEKALLSYRLNPLPLRSPEKVSAANNQLLTFINQGLIEKAADGTYKLTKEGVAAYGDVNKYIPGIGPGTKGTYKTIPSSFKLFILDNLSELERHNSSSMHDWINKIAGKIKQDSYDTYHTTEFDRQLDDTYGKKFMSQIKSAYMNDEEISVLNSFDRKSGWDKSTDKIKLADLEDYTVTNVRPSKYGITAIILKGNDIKRIKVPRQINPSAYDGALGYALEVARLQELKDKKLLPVLDDTGSPVLNKDGSIKTTNTPASQADLLRIDNMIKEATDMMSLYGSQLVVPSKTKDEEFDSINY